ncbi:MAG: hypothetical protein M1818_007633 [Claussenomyces sp. TS43310]|nr:MAG: hypothetical protein M1818_007633 [Claussenomyces sp. TS43310]
MSYPEQPGGPYPPRDMRDPNESQYPPPPGEEDDRARAYHQRAPSAGGITLPSMSQSITSYDQQYGMPGVYQQDPRYRPDPYRDVPQGGYGRDDRSYQGDYGRGGPQQMSFQQSAPRQRTAIACRYCRRRKIRCSGFEQSADGRCSNCQRFQQECIFTPVSSQAQAFVPAHAVYPHMRNMGVGVDGRPRPMMYPQGQQVYGAHGQPLGQVPPPQLSGSPYNEYHVPSPTGSYSSFTEERGEPSRKRSQAEPHPAILPPPVPGQPSYREESGNRRPAAQDDLRLPPVTPTPGPAAPSNYSPGSSTSPVPGLRPPPENVSTSSRTPPPRSSPGERADPMSLGSIMEKGPSTDIDQKMLGRLNRKG